MLPVDAIAREQNCVIFLFLFQRLYTSLLVGCMNFIVVVRVIWDQLNQHWSNGPQFINDADLGCVNMR